MQLAVRLPALFYFFDLLLVLLIHPLSRLLTPKLSRVSRRMAGIDTIPGFMILSCAAPSGPSPSLIDGNHA